MPHWGMTRPIASTQLMVQLAREHGLSLAACLAGSGITAEQIDDVSSEVQGLQELHVLRNILRALGPEVPFPLLAGRRYHLTTHGMWGFTQLTSCDAREAIAMSLRYWDLSYSFNQLSLEVEGEEGRLLYDCSENPEDLQAALVQRDLAALVSFENDALGHTLPALSLRLRGPRPNYAKQLEALFAVAPEFECEVNCLSFRADFLKIRNPFANRFGVRVSAEQCQRLLEERAKRDGVAGRVRIELSRNLHEVPTMDAVASKLGVTRRTLHNQLAREGTSFRALVEHLRTTLAEELLADSRLSIDEIAVRLGYTDASSFTAAFKRWKGIPPGEFRRQLPSSAPAHGPCAL